MKKLTILAIAILIFSFISDAQRTTREGLKAAQTEVAVTPVSQSVFDTIAPPAAHQVDFNGYDKPLRSRRETFFATNNSKDSIAAMAFTITYYDGLHRMLHSAKHKVSIDIPAGETRQVSLKSWDPQFNFYYIRSAVPQRTQKATPYEITIAIDTLFVKTPSIF